MRNVTGPPVMGDDLYGRQQAIDRLWSRLGGGEHLLMLAPRRVGKTSLMRELHRDPRANWDVAYVDVEGADGAADFVASVLAALAGVPGNQSWAQTIGLPHAVKDALASFTKGKVKLNLLVVQLKGLIRRDWIQTMDRLETRLSRLPNQRRLLIIVDELPILISRMTGAAGTPHLDHYAARLEFAFGPPESDLARAVLAIACQRADGATQAELAVASERASVLAEVLQALEADGYLVRSGTRVAFRSNLLRVWWRKHRAAAS